jgi:hypothetical protein
MLQSLFGVFMPRLVILFSVMRRGGAVRVRRLLVKLSRPLMRIVGHFLFSSGCIFNVSALVARCPPN